MNTSTKMALACLLAAMTPAEQVLVTGSLADALAYAAGAGSVAAQVGGSDSVAAVRPGAAS